MQRRSFLSGAAATAALPLPAIAQPAKARILRFVPQANLTILDPIVTTAGITLNHGYAVFDTLFGTRSDFKPEPQMAEGYRVSDDGLSWTIVLREGLRFHDGEPVRAADCAASLARWSKRDSFGQTLGAAVEAWQAVDDRTLRIALRRPFPRLLEALAYLGPSPAFIMPERLAQTDPYKSIPEIIGSGPFRFLKDEYVPGSHVGYARFEGYVPRQEPPSLNAGGKVAHFDRLEWKVIPDSATAAAALQAGEVDWWESADADLASMLAKNRAVKVQPYDPAGFIGFLRFNTLAPPFDKPAVRRIVLSAVNQADYMSLITGGDDTAWHVSRSMFPAGFPSVTEAGASAMAARTDFDALARELRAAGYAGEKIVILSPTDIAGIAPFGDVTASLLRRMGMNVDLQVMDWGTVVQRRTSREPIDKGGWSIFHTTAKSNSIPNPALNLYIRGQGDRGWFGWFKSEEIERETADWLQASAGPEERRLFDAVHRTAFEQVPVIPLGQFMPKTAFRNDITGVLSGPAAFLWNVRRS